jgi:hypothetical protein
MRIHDKAFLSWAVFGLALLLGAGYFASLASSAPAAAAPVPPWAPFLVLVCIAVSGGLAWSFTRRGAEAERCRNSSLHLRHVVDDLGAEDERTQRRALRTLTDYYEEPFGAVNLFWCRPDQLDALIVLYREWWRANQPSEQPPARPVEQVAREAAAELQPQAPPVIEKLAPDKPHPQGSDRPSTPVLERLLLRLRSSIWPQTRQQGPLCPPEVVLDRLAQMNREDFIQAMQIPVEDTLLLAADIINEVRDTAAFLHAQERVPDLFAGLGRTALEQGWQLRFDAEEQRRQAPRLSWAAQFRRMKMAEIGLLPTPEPSETAAPASGGAPEAASWQEILHTLRGQLERKLDRLAEVIKNALLDSGPAGAPPEPDQEPLPPLEREEFIRAMRGRVEQALGQMADVLKESDDTEGVRVVLAELLWDALNLSARLRAATPAPALTAPDRGLTERP